MVEAFSSPNQQVYDVGIDNVLRYFPGEGAFPRVPRKITGSQGFIVVVGCSGVGSTLPSLTFVHSGNMGSVCSSRAGGYLGNSEAFIPGCTLWWSKIQYHEFRNLRSHGFVCTAGVSSTKLKVFVHPIPFGEVSMCDLIAETNIIRVGVAIGGNVDVNHNHGTRRAKRYS